jgi:hypothetical protein
MTVKKLLAAVVAVVVLIPGAAGLQHDVEQSPAAMALADGTTTDNTPWT